MIENSIKEVGCHRQAAVFLVIVIVEARTWIDIDHGPPGEMER
jgi:hypothetical protein